MCYIRGEFERKAKRQTFCYNCSQYNRSMHAVDVVGVVCCCRSLFSLLSFSVFVFVEATKRTGGNTSKKDSCAPATLAVSFLSETENLCVCIHLRYDPQLKLLL